MFVFCVAARETLRASVGRADRCRWRPLWQLQACSRCWPRELFSSWYSPPLHRCPPSTVGWGYPFKFNNGLTFHLKTLLRWFTFVEQYSGTIELHSTLPSRENCTLTKGNRKRQGGNKGLLLSKHLHKGLTRGHAWAGGACSLAARLLHHDREWVDTTHQQSLQYHTSGKSLSTSDISFPLSPQPT